MSIKRKRPTRLIGGSIVLVAIGMFLLFRFQSAPLQTVPTISAHSVTAPEPKVIEWPRYGQSAIATSGYGVLESHGDTTPQPTASTAKLITMLALMKKKPFSDAKRASITFSQTDVDRYNTYVAGNGSVVPVTNGLTWTQYQAMEAVLLESANNVADSLAVWAFGSLEAYRAYAQKMVQEIGMNHTTIGTDASGYHPTTTSTASDLALLAREVLKEPMLRQIVDTSSTSLPGAGRIQNTNRFLGSEVVGMKTGYTPEAGGVFVLAGVQNDSGHTQDIITVVMGAPGITSSAAQSAAYTLYESAKQNFRYQTVIRKGDTLASYRPAWSGTTYDMVADESLGTFVWSAGPKPQVTVIAPHGRDGGQVEGSVAVTYGNVTMNASGHIASPIPNASWWWRIFGH